MERVELTAEIPLDAQGERLDQVAARLFPDYSRSRLQGWIKSGELLLDGAEARTRDKVRPGQVITVGAEVEQVVSWEGQAIELDILYEDADIIVLNKPAG